MVPSHSTHPGNTKSPLTPWSFNLETGAGHKQFAWILPTRWLAPVAQAGMPKAPRPICVQNRQVSEANAAALTLDVGPFLSWDSEGWALLVWLSITKENMRLLF